MRKRILIVLFLSLLAATLLGEGLKIISKKIYKERENIRFLLEFEIPPGLDISDLHKSLKIKVKEKVFSLENIRKEKMDFGQAKNVEIKGGLQIKDKKALNRDSITFIVDYELCDSITKACIISEKKEIKVNFDFSKLKKKTFNVLSLVLLFLSGIATSFTPCVFPLIPLVFGFIGATGKNPKRALALSSTMVLSMGVVYTVLGVFAALSGKVFGSVTKSPGFLIGAGLVMFLMGLSLMGFLPFKTPSFVSKGMRRYKGKGFLSAVTMGLFLGAIGAPCVGPVLVSVLTYVSTTQNVLLGAIMLFSYSMGMGLFFVVIGTLSQSLGKNFSQGMWMESLKNFFSLLIIGGGFYFVSIGLKTNLLMYVFLLFAGLWIIKESFKIERGRVKAGLVLAAILTIAVPSYKLYNVIHRHGSKIFGEKGVLVGWENSYNGALEKAVREKKIVFIDFFADWCENCHKLEKSIEKVYPEVKDNVVFLRIKMESQGKERESLVRKYNIVGLPRVVIECPEGGKKIGSFFGYRDESSLKKIIKKAIEDSSKRCGG